MKKGSIILSLINFLPHLFISLFGKPFLVSGFGAFKIAGVVKKDGCAVGFRYV